MLLTVHWKLLYFTVFWTQHAKQLVFAAGYAGLHHVQDVVLQICPGC